MFVGPDCIWAPVYKYSIFLKKKKKKKKISIVYFSAQVNQLTAVSGSFQRK
jgi:hypothetical protein